MVVKVSNNDNTNPQMEYTTLLILQLGDWARG